MAANRLGLWSSIALVGIGVAYVVDAARGGTRLCAARLSASSLVCDNQQRGDCQLSENFKVLETVVAPEATE